MTSPQNSLSARFFENKVTVVYICFWLSGLSALIYEVAWLSRIQLVMGYTVYALTTTLCAYLTGLALGALLVLVCSGRGSVPSGSI